MNKGWKHYKYDFSVIKEMKIWDKFLAERVVNTMKWYISEYGSASLADLMELLPLINITPGVNMRDIKFIDCEMVWTDVTAFKVCQSDLGYYSVIVDFDKLRSEKLLMYENEKPDWSLTRHSRYQETFLALNEAEYREHRHKLAQEWEV